MLLRRFVVATEREVVVVALRFVVRRAVPVSGVAHRATRHQVINLAFVNGFVFDQRLGHAVQDVHVVFQDFFGTRVVAVDDAADFGVNGVRGFVRDVFVLGDRAAEEDFAFFFAVSERSHFFGQPPAGNHAARNGGGAFDVV